MSNEFPELFARWDTFSSAVWFRSKAGRYRLEGTQCTACGEKFFPPRTGLICPNCQQRAMQPYACAQTGSIAAAALDDIGFPATGYETYLPRCMVIIRLDDGIHIMSELSDVSDPAAVQPGARVRMVLRKHKREDTGAWVYGYRFVLDPAA
ncbi:MAG: OB-fold domain-containing protein [Longilinea sp.]|nr:OB-fold domain-containing protein [Longilinea sp.]